MAQWKVDATNVFPTYVEPEYFDYECPNCGTKASLDRFEVGGFTHKDTNVIDVDCLNCGDQIDVCVRNERLTVKDKK